MGVVGELSHDPTVLPTPRTGACRGPGWGMRGQGSVQGRLRQGLVPPHVQQLVPRELQPEHLQGSMCMQTQRTSELSSGPPRDARYCSSQEKSSA